MQWITAERYSWTFELSDKAKKGNEQHRRLVPSEGLCAFSVEEALKQDAAHDENQRDDCAGVEPFVQKDGGDNHGEEGGMAGLAMAAVLSASRSASAHVR